ncbi:MAG: glycosyltransferase [Solirubrobacterales bacterium]
MSTVLAYTSPAAGHAFPLVPGLLALRARGHSVQLRTAPDLVDPIAAAGLDACPVDARVASIPVDDHLADSGRQRLSKGFERLLSRGEHERDDLARAIVETRPDALLVDCIAYGAAVEAERSGLPWAMTLPSLLPLPGAGVPPYGLGLAPLRGPLGGLRDRVGWMLVERLYRGAMMPRLNQLRAGAGLEELAGPIDNLHRPNRILVLTGAPLEYPRRDLPAHVRMLGSQCWDPPAAQPEWLHEPGDPWVLVTCSTEYQGDEALAAAAIEALRGEPVRVVVTLGDVAAAGLPAADNVRLERFVPHGPVLQSAAAVVCHGGMGITEKAIAAGVPLVAVPFGRDQPEVARRVVEAGVGVRLTSRRLTPERLRAAVRAATALGAGLRPLEPGTLAARAQGFATAAEELTAAAGAQPSSRASSTRERTSSLA